MKTYLWRWVMLWVMLSMGRMLPAADWPQWRGPKFNGSSDAKNLPDHFSKTENVLWSTAMPGPSNATPVIFGDRIFVSSLDSASKQVLALCVARKDGAILWRKDIAVGAIARGNNNMVSPSPVTDGKSVYFLYATGDLVAFDTVGKELWARNLVKDHGSFNFNWIYASSPLLYKGKLYVPVMHRDRPYERGAASNGPAPSYLLAIDPTTGKDLWKHVRPDDANGESKEAYTTPIPFEGKGRSEIVLAGGDCVTGHDPETGAELWRVGGFLNPNHAGDRRLVPSVVTGDGMVFACGPKSESVAAIREGGSGDVTATHIAWKTKNFTSDVPVPLFYQGKLYVLDDRRRIVCVDPKTGEKQWSLELGGGPVFRASPTGADGKIYCVNEGGDVWVASASEPKIISKTSLGGGATRGSISVADGFVLVRTGETLYAFGGK